MSKNTTKVTVKSKNITENSKKSTQIFVAVALILSILMIGAVIVKGILDYAAERERERQRLEDKAHEYYKKADELNETLKQLEKKLR